MFIIIAFICFFIAIFINDSYANLFFWPVAIIIFVALFFASYNLQTTTTVVSTQNVTIVNESFSTSNYDYETARTYYQETAFSWMFLALGLLSIILFIWDIWQKKSGQ
jgi:flagellar motor component MotA